MNRGENEGLVRLAYLDNVAIIVENLNWRHLAKFDYIDHWNSKKQFVRYGESRLRKKVVGVANGWMSEPTEPRYHDDEYVNRY